MTDKALTDSKTLNEIRGLATGAQPFGSFAVDENQPLISLVILAYNQEMFIRDAVEGAFSQTYSPLEIVLSDDCSNDQTFQIMQEMASSYDGPHTVTLNRNERNLGIGNHYWKIIQISRGDWVASAGGDDISLPNRIQNCATAVSKCTDVAAISTAVRRFGNSHTPCTPQIETADNRNSLTEFTLSDFANSEGIFPMGASRMVKRSSITKFGPLTDRCPTEDTPALLRCLLTGKCLTLAEAGVLYRIHGSNTYESPNRRNINFDILAQEYRHTITQAVSEKLVTKTFATALLRKLIKKLSRQRRLAVQEHPNSAFESVATTIGIIASKGEFTLREKAARCKFMLKELFRN